jgi:hypothetical protein
MPPRLSDLNHVRRYLTPAELVARWDNILTEGTLANWRVQHIGPAYVRLGTRIVYAVADIEAYEAAQRVPGRMPANDNNKDKPQ